MNETLTFDAGWLARAWLSVAEASSRDKARPMLDRTVCVGVNPPTEDEASESAA